MSLNYNGFSKLGKNHPQVRKWKEDQLHGEGSQNSYEFLVNQLGHDREELGSSNNRWFNSANVPGSDAYDALTCKAMPVDGHNDEDIELEDGWLVQKKENSDSDQYSIYPHYILFSKDGSTLMTGFGQSYGNNPTFSIYDMNKVGDKYEFTKSGDVDMGLAGPRTSWGFNNSGNDGLMTRGITDVTSPFKNSISLTKNSIFGLYDTDGNNYYARQAGFVVRQRDDSNTVWDENIVKSTFMYDVEFSLLTSADSAENLSSGEIYGVVGDYYASNHLRSGNSSDPVNPNSRICFFHALPFENWNGWPIVKLTKTQYEDIFDPDNNAYIPAWADAHDINANGDDRSSGLQDSDEAYFSFQSIRIDGIGSWAREGRYPGLKDLVGGGNDHSACKAYAPGQTNNGQTFDTWTGDSTWDALDNYISVHPNGIRTSLGTSIQDYFDAQNIDYSTNFWKYRSDQVMAGSSYPYYPVAQALMNGESAFPKYFFTENHDKEISGAISSDDNGIGSAVSLSEDGQTIAYSSEWTDDPDVFLSNNRGWVKVSTWNESTKAWDQIGDTLKGDNAGDYFGRFVKLSPDGMFLVVGGAKTAKVFYKEPDVIGYKWTQKGANISIETLIQNDWTENSWGNPDSTHLSKCQIESINIGRPNDTNDFLEDENTRIYIGCPLAPSGIADADHGLYISGGSESADGTVNPTCFGAIFVLEWSTTDSEWKTNVSSANFSKAIFGTNGAIYNHSRGLQSDLSKTGTINTNHYPSYWGGRFPMTIGYCFSTAAVGELFAFGGWNNFLNCNNNDLDCSRPKDVAELTQAFVLSRYVLADSDEDGVSDDSDAFPNDPSEWGDIDADGVGDNSDAFPKDPSESVDSDGDGVGDNADSFPNDPNLTSNAPLWVWGDDSSNGNGYFFPVYLSDAGLGANHQHVIDGVTYYMENSAANHAASSLGNFTGEKAPNSPNPADSTYQIGDILVYAGTSYEVIDLIWSGSLWQLALSQDRTDPPTTVSQTLDENDQHLNTWIDTSPISFPYTYNFTWAVGETVRYNGADHTVAEHRGHRLYDLTDSGGTRISDVAADFISDPPTEIPGSTTLIQPNNVRTFSKIDWLYYTDPVFGANTLQATNRLNYCITSNFDAFYPIYSCGNLSPDSWGVSGGAHNDRSFWAIETEKNPTVSNFSNYDYNSIGHSVKFWLAFYEAKDSCLNSNAGQTEFWSPSFNRRRWLIGYLDNKWASTGLSIINNSDWLLKKAGTSSNKQYGGDTYSVTTNLQLTYQGSSNILKSDGTEESTPFTWQTRLGGTPAGIYLDNWTP